MEDLGSSSAMTEGHMFDRDIPMLLADFSSAAPPIRDVCADNRILWASCSFDVMRWESPTWLNSGNDDAHGPDLARKAAADLANSMSALISLSFPWNA
jgi:hypothetical protein